MEKLKAHLESLIDELEDSFTVYDRLQNLISVYPFNEYEYMISTLLGRGKLTLDDYYALRDEYIERNLYSISSRSAHHEGSARNGHRGTSRSWSPNWRSPPKRKIRRTPGSTISGLTAG